MKKMIKPFYLESMPDRNIDFPRDSNTLARTGDILYMAAILKNWSGQIKTLNIYRLGNSYAYFFECSSGNLYHPLNMALVEPDNAMLLKGKQKKASVRKNFNRFFLIRDFLNMRKRSDQTLFIRDERLFEEGVPINAVLEEFNENLKWPLYPADELRNNFSDYLLNFDLSLNNESFDAICPIDGRIKMTECYMASPEWTWPHLCGRKFRVLICPECFGHFYNYLIEMS